MTSTSNRTRIRSLLAIILAIGLLFTACTSGGTPAEQSAEPAADNSESTPAPTDASEEPADGADTAATVGSSLEGKRVRVVIGSTSTSGDSYMMADAVTRYLSEELGFNGKVDAIGNARALEEIVNAKGDGTTIMMFHDMAFMSVLFDAMDEKYALENLTVGPRIGQNPGACFGANFDKPYDNLKEMADWLKDNPEESVRVNIEAGGTSHIAFAAFYIWAQENYDASVIDRIKVIVGGSTAEKLQTLWDGNADVIFGDYSAFIQYTEEGVDDQLKMKIMDPLDEIEGVDIPTMADNGITFDGEPFVFPKDFCMYLPKDMDPDVLADLEAAMHNVATNPDLISDLAALKYKPVDMNVEDSKEFIYQKRQTCKELIELSPNLDDITT